MRCVNAYISGPHAAADSAAGWAGRMHIYTHHMDVPAHTVKAKRAHTYMHARSHARAHTHARTRTRAHARTHHLRLRAGCCSYAITQPLELVWLKPLTAAAMLLNTYARASVRACVSE